MDYPKPFKRKNSPFWYFRYTDPDTGKRKLVCTKKTLKREANEVIHERINNIKITGSSSKPLGAYLSLFSSIETNPKYQEAKITDAAYSKAHARTVAGMMSQLILIIPTTLQKKNIDTFTPVDLKYIARILVDNYGQCRKSQNMFKQVKAIFNWAADNRLIPYSPATKIRDIKYEAKKRNALSLKTVLTVYSSRSLFSCNDAFDFFRVAATTGMRRGELLALSSEQIKDGVLVIDRAVKDYDGFIGTTKTGKTRIIPLSKTTISILSTRIGNGLIFNNNNKPYSQKTIATWYGLIRESVNKSDLSADIISEFSESSLHSLRHSLATYVRFAGVHDALVKSYFGWSLKEDTDMIERYTHTGSILYKVADAIDDIFSYAAQNKS